MEVLLYNSTVCRLCGEENDSGTLLYSCEENSQNLSEVINTYLPIKVSDDGVLPRTICPGCTIQLEATVEFFNLIISGQKVIRELHQREKEYKKSLQKEPENILTEKIVYEINTSDGVYTIEHPIALQVAGLERPKRKRGRPPKKPKTPQEIAEEAAVRDRELKEKEESKKEDVSGKRRRKTPTRFKGAVQGKELERIFKEEGVTEGSESEAETRAEPPQGAVPREPEVIGHLAASGELVVLVRGKGRGRPKGRMRQTKHECAICGMEFSSVGRYMSHVAQHGPVLFQCAACEKSFEAMLEFRAHQMETGHTGRKVMPCSTAANGEIKLENVTPSHHEPDATGQAEGAEEVNISLPYCTLKPEDNSNPLPLGPDSATEVNKNEVQTDVESTIDVAVVDETDPLAEAAEQPETSGANTKEKVKLKCNHCDKLFSSKQSKSMHIKAVHQGEKPYVCVECGCRFAYPRSLALHHVSHRRRARPRRYACDLCPKVLNHPSSVVYHKEAEHAGQCYVCNKCGKSFKHKQLLRRHQLVHTQARPFECTQCNATFKTKANLMNHQLLHSGVKKFTCEICKYKFAHKTSLTLHMRWHTGSKPYVCNVCGKGFSQKGNLSEHERIHTGEKPFVCNQCGRRFTTSSQYRLHARRHQPDKTYYACQHCPKKFATHCGWLAHRRKEISRREHVCATCGRAFAERWALHKHSRKHTGERPFRCPHCPRTFADCSNLNKHKKFVHRQISLLVNDKDQAMQQPLLLQQEQLLEQQPTDDALDPDAHGSVIVMDSMDTMDSVQQELLEQQSEEDAQIDPDDGVIVMNSMDTMDSVQEQDADAERVIYVAYDVDEPESTFHIIDPEQAAAIDSGVVTSCSLFPRVLASPEPEEAPAELAQPREVTALTAPMTDEQGNPLLFTMSDGTRLAITSTDGKSLQVVTQDGQTIPVQINGYPEEEQEVDSLPSTVHLELDSAATEAAVTHYFTIV